jgi:hypothetical protein
MLLVVLFAVVFMVGFNMVILITLSRIAEREREYAKLLEQYPLEVVIRASRSPEYSGTAHEATRKYLNAKHPGWSLKD